MDIYQLQELSAEEIYAHYCRGINPRQLFDQGRTEIATGLRIKEGLSQDAAYYAADQILVHTQDLLDRQMSDIKGST